MLSAIFIIVSIFYFIYQSLIHPLARYPGPAFASFTNLWKAYHVFLGDYEQVLLELHRKHGKFVRIGPNHLDVSDVDAIKDIYWSGKPYVKSSFYHAFTTLRPNIFGTTDESIHSARKKALSAGFSLQSVNQMEPYIDTCLSKLIGRLDQAADNGEVIDLKSWVSFFVIDVLGELAFSRSFNMLEKGQVEALPPLKEHMLLSMISGQLPWVIPYVNNYLPYVPIPSLQKVVQGRKRLRKMAVDCVEMRLENPDPGRRDLLAKLIDEYERGRDARETGLDVVDVQTEAFGFIIAGSHTTATTITFLFWHLLRNPNVLSKLETEIQDISKPEDEAVCYPYSNTVTARYLSAVVNETFRISPVFVMPLMRVVPDGGGVVAGQRIPGGTDVSICNHALHHNPEIFGGDLEAFVPERWIGDGQEKTKYLMHFGSGHRACIGRNLASVEINKVVTSLLSRYHFEPIESGHEDEVTSSMPPTTSFGIADLDGQFLVKLWRRGS